MTKREIFERLQNIRDYARVTDTWPHDNAAEQNLHLRNAVEAIAKDLGELLLDLAAPETDADAAERIKRILETSSPLSAEANLSGSKREDEKKHPGIIVDPKGEHPPRCLRCGLDAEIVQFIGRGEEWASCPLCGCAYRIKGGKDKK